MLQRIEIPILTYLIKNVAGKSVLFPQISEFTSYFVYYEFGIFLCKKITVEPTFSHSMTVFQRAHIKRVYFARCTLQSVMYSIAVLL